MGFDAAENAAGARKAAVIITIRKTNSRRGILKIITLSGNDYSLNPFRQKTGILNGGDGRDAKKTCLFQT